MDPQVAFGAPDGWPTYSRTAHSTWELAGILQDIHPESRSHERCFSHVYMKTLGFQSLLPRLDTFNTFFERSSNDHEIICKEQLPGHPTLKSLDKASSTVVTGEFPLKKASDSELWCFIWSAPEQTVEQTIETHVIWDAVAYSGVTVKTKISWQNMHDGKVATNAGLIQQSDKDRLYVRPT